MADFLEILANLIIEEVVQVKSGSFEHGTASTCKSADDISHGPDTSSTFRRPMNSEGMANGHLDSDTSVHLMDIDSGIDTSDSCDEKKKKDIKSLPKPTRRFHSRMSSSKDSTPIAQQH